MKDLNYTLNIDAALLKEKMTLEQFLNHNSLNTDQYQMLNMPKDEADHSVLSLKDRSIANRIIKAFLDTCGGKMHVTSISTNDEMVVRLSL